MRDLHRLEIPGYSCRLSLRFSPALVAPSTAQPLRSAAVGFGGCRGAGIGTEQQGIEPGLEIGQPLVLAPQLLGFCLDLLDLDRERVHPPLVVGIATPVEHRQPLSPQR